MIRFTRYEEYTKSTGFAFSAAFAFSAGLSAYSVLDSVSSTGLSSFISFAFPSESDGCNGQQVLNPLVEVLL